MRKRRMLDLMMTSLSANSGAREDPLGNSGKEDPLATSVTVIEGVDESTVNRWMQANEGPNVIACSDEESDTD